MKEFDGKIAFTNFLIAVVIIIGLLATYGISRPLIIETYEKISNGTHLSGQVFTAKDLTVTIHPDRLFYDKWDASSGYDGDFTCRCRWDNLNASGCSFCEKAA